MFFARTRASGAFSPLFRWLRAQLSCLRQQLPSHHPKIRQCEQCDHLGRVLHQSLEAHLLVTELPLHHAERMLGVCTKARLQGRQRLRGFLELTFLHLLHPTALLRDVPLALTPINANVRLHPEVPLVAFPGLVHLGIALLVLVLRRRRRRDDRGIDDRAAPKQQPPLGQVRVHRFQKPRRQLMRLQQPPEIQHRGLVRERPGQRQLRELAHRYDLVQRLFHRRIAQAEPVLQHVDAQHRGHRIRAATATRLRIVRLDQRQQFPPSNHPLHLRKKMRLRLPEYSRSPNVSCVMPSLPLGRNTRARMSGDRLVQRFLREPSKDSATLPSHITVMVEETSWVAGGSECRLHPTPRTKSWSKAT